MKSNKDKKRILWIITELFYPEQTSTAFILSKIADRMSNKYLIKVITVNGLYDKSSLISGLNFQINEEIEIQRINIKQRDKNNLRERSKNVINVSFKLAHALYKQISSGDKVLTVTNPAPILVLLPFIKIVKSFEYFILVHDVFPENTIPTGIIKSKSSWVYKIISKIFNKAYAKADCLIVLGRDMKKKVYEKISSYNKKPYIEIIENWAEYDILQYTGKEIQLIKDRHEADIVTLQYAGNIGRLQGLDYFLNTFMEVNNTALCLDFWGDGAVKNALIKKVNNHVLSKNINFLGSYHRDEQNDILRTTDIAIVTLSEGMYGLGVPSKTYNILAAGIPILFVGDLQSEIAIMLNDYKIGFCFSPSDNEGLKEFLSGLNIKMLPILKEMGNVAQNVAKKYYNEDTILEKYLKII